MGESDLVGVGIINTSKINQRTQSNRPVNKKEDANRSRPELGKGCVMEGVRKEGIIFADEGIGPSNAGSGGPILKEAIGFKGRKWKRTARSGPINGIQSGSNGSEYDKRDVYAIGDGFIVSSKKVNNDSSSILSTLSVDRPSPTRCSS